MKFTHVPTINTRYWSGIALASVFGTNLGDLYAHESGLGLLGGLPILVVLFLCVYAAERFDKFGHDAYYWLCIIIMRTGATNIADYMAGRRHMHIDRLELTVGLGVLLAVLSFLEARSDKVANTPHALKTLPNTNPLYWVAMLTAGVFGTVFGDWCQGVVGQGLAAVGLTAILLVVLMLYRKDVLKSVHGYWLAIAVARTTGTAIGDWLAESKVANLGLSLATVLSGVAFVAVLVLWRSRRVAEATPAG
ncbi:MAG TPA: hypothetical protein VL358_01900 [Caulobacteraceae bacterium]|jgi:uncharacterized membrane-anchored protein|nr:hypothetical protein [Caulobacteraceae bacterium]